MEKQIVAAVRIKGIADVPEKIRHTLDMLRLRKKFVCCIYKPTPSILGMLEKAKAYIAYGNINDEILKELILKRGRKPGDKKLNQKEVEKVFAMLKEGNFDEAYKIIKPFFRLSPPRGGFKKTTKLMWPQGVCGNVGEKINELIARMI